VQRLESPSAFVQIEVVATSSKIDLILLHKTNIFAVINKYFTSLVMKLFYYSGLFRCVQSMNKVADTFDVILVHHNCKHFF